MPAMPQKRGRLADRAAGVGAGGPQAQPGRHRRGRAARAAAGHQGGVVAGAGPGVAHTAIVGGHVGRAHGELVEVGLAQADRTRLPELAADGRFVGRDEAVQDVRAGGGQHALGAEQVLDRQRHALEQAALAGGQPRVGRVGHGQRTLGRLGDEGVEVAVPLDRRDMRPGQLGRREAAGAQAVARGLEREAGELAHSTTFGTTK